MPSWAKHNPAELWECADLFERKNGSTYREHVVGLPRELNKESKRLALVKEWIAQEVGMPHSVALHNVIASDGEQQPHIHLMFCERLQDGHRTHTTAIFKRYNSKDPSKGGARKDNTGKTPQQRELEIKEQRLRWQEMANRHFTRSRLCQALMLELKDKGLDEAPTNKPMWQWQAEKRAEAIIDNYRPKPPEPIPEPSKPKPQPNHERDNSPSFGF